MKDRMLYSQLKKRSLEREIKGGYLELLFVFTVNFLIVFLNLLIEDSQHIFGWQPFLLFLLPAFWYLYLALETKKLMLGKNLAFIVGVLYILFCLIEFYYGYHIDDWMRIYLSDNGEGHPLAYVLQLLPIVYKTFKIALVIPFFKIAYNWNKIERLKD